jgi:hypothetical protein
VSGGGKTHGVGGGSTGTGGGYGDRPVNDQQGVT